MKLFLTLSAVIVAFLAAAIVIIMVATRPSTPAPAPAAAATPTATAAPQEPSVASPSDDVAPPGQNVSPWELRQKRRHASSAGERSRE